MAGVGRKEMERTGRRVIKGYVLIWIGARGERMNNLGEVEGKGGEVEEDGFFELRDLGEVEGERTIGKGSCSREKKENDKKKGGGHEEGILINERKSQKELEKEACPLGKRKVMFYLKIEENFRLTLTHLNTHAKKKKTQLILGDRK